MRIPRTWILDLFSNSVCVRQSFVPLSYRRIPGLFFAGEVIDVDGITGGFNFQNAWTSAWCAGSAIVDDANAWTHGREGG